MSNFSEHFFGTADSAQWEQYLPAGQSVFGSVQFAKICERFRGQTARLHVVQTATGSVCSPMLLRSLNELPFRADVASKWDATTPEYTGPLPLGDVGIQADEYRKLRANLMRREGVAAGFAHLHPWRCDQQLLGGGVELNREIVWIDLTISPETLFREHFAHGCRKNIQKAMREGVVTGSATSDEAVAEFFRIYTGTMQRNHALDRYAFSLDYFKAVRDLLPRNARFSFAHYQGRAIAATLYLHDDGDVYSYLGGADAEFNYVRPTNLLVWDTIGWAHKAGKKRFILGGGYGPEDGIFRFKATFSKLRQPFFVCKQIHDPHDYQALVARSREHYGPKEDNASYFPSYRYSG
jgi:hypothetical protein